MKNFTDFINFTEPEHRYCPICDEEIRMGSLIHKCSKKKLKEIEKMSKILDEEADLEADLEVDLEAERSYDDRLQEYKYHFNNNSYYDTEEDE